MTRSGGFTLIEMLIVIAVIAILSGIVITGISGFQASARDTKRVADLRSTQNLLELYFNACGHYPGDSACGNNDPANWGALSTSVKGKLGISNFPEPPGGISDPIAGARFLYEVSPTQTSYVLGAELEGDSNALRESFNPPAWLNDTDIPCGEGTGESLSVFCVSSE